MKIDENKILHLNKKDLEDIAYYLQYPHPKNFIKDLNEIFKIVENYFGLEFLKSNSNNKYPLSIQKIYLDAFAEYNFNTDKSIHSQSLIKLSYISNIILFIQNNCPNHLEQIKNKIINGNSFSEVFYEAECAYLLGQNSNMNIKFNSEDSKNKISDLRFIFNKEIFYAECKRLDNSNISNFYNEIALLIKNYVTVPTKIIIYTLNENLLKQNITQLTKQIQKNLENKLYGDFEFCIELKYHLEIISSSIKQNETPCELLIYINEAKNLANKVKRLISEALKQLPKSHASIIFIDLNGYEIQKQEHADELMRLLNGSFKLHPRLSAVYITNWKFTLENKTTFYKIDILENINQFPLYKYELPNFKLNPIDNLELIDNR